MIIIYRGCNSEMQISQMKHNRPRWFDKRACFRSLISSINNAFTDVSKLHVILDGDDGDLTDYIERAVADLNIIPFEIEKIQLKSNALSLNYVYDTYMSKYAGSTVYFVEDDYLNKPNAIEMIAAGADKFGLVTGYDHTDRYTRYDDAPYPLTIRLCNNMHWRTAESTTCTWAARGDVAVRIVPEAKKYLLEDRTFFRSLIKSGHYLYTPIPGVTTHMNEMQLSPNFDWQAEAANHIYK